MEPFPHHGGVVEAIYQDSTAEVGRGWTGSLPDGSESCRANGNATSKILGKKDSWRVKHDTHSSRLRVVSVVTLKSLARNVKGTEAQAALVPCHRSKDFDAALLDASRLFDNQKIQTMPRFP
jgi:hypothetical protein